MKRLHIGNGRYLFVYVFVSYCIFVSFFFFRYSHTAHVVDDNLVLIGGVTPISSHPPGVIVLHLKNLTWKSYTLPACLTPSIPLMLHNHCSVCWEDSQGIMVLGGGGNCFSFGTHFNDGPVFLDLSPLGEAVAFKCA